MDIQNWSNIWTFEAPWINQVDQTRILTIFKGLFTLWRKSDIMARSKVLIFQHGNSKKAKIRIDCLVVVSFAWIFNDHNGWNYIVIYFSNFSISDISNVCLLEHFFPSVEVLLILPSSNLQNIWKHYYYIKFPSFSSPSTYYLSQLNWGWKKGHLLHL